MTAKIHIHIKTYWMIYKYDCKLDNSLQESDNLPFVTKYNEVQLFAAILTCSVRWITKVAHLIAPRCGKFKKSDERQGSRHKLKFMNELIKPTISRLVKDISQQRSAHKTSQWTQPICARKLPCSWMYCSMLNTNILGNSLDFSLQPEESKCYN